MTMLIFPSKEAIITIDVFYYFPDNPLLIQEFIWQTEDIVPQLIRTRKFLKYWERNIEGQIKEVVLSGLNSDGSATRFQTIDEILSL